MTEEFPESYEIFNRIIHKLCQWGKRRNDNGVMKYEINLCGT